MPYNDQFEENIRQRFSGARMEPSPDVWKRLEAQLPTNEQKRIIPFWKSATLLAIAAAFAIIVYSAATSPSSATTDLPQSEIADAEKTTPPLKPKQSEVIVQTIDEVPEEEPLEVNTAIPRQVSQSKTIAQHTPIYNGDPFDTPGENNELGPVMNSGSDFYIKSRLPRLSLVKPVLSSIEQLADIPELNIPQKEWLVNPLYIDDLKKNKPGKKGLFALFAQGGSGRSGLGNVEVGYVTIPADYTNQGAYPRNDLDLPVQMNLYPQWVSSATVGTELFLSDNISMQAGFGMSKFSQNTLISLGQENSLASIDGTNSVDPIYLTSERVVSANKLNHIALNIPVGVNLYAGNDKRAIAVQAEVLYQPVLSSPNDDLNRGSYDLAALTTTGRTNITQNKIENDLLNRHALSGRIGLRLQQHIGNGFHVYGGPGLSYALNPAYSSSSAGFDQKNLGLGFEMGVKWQQLR